jgi:pyruvate,water dikinase
MIWIRWFDDIGMADVATVGGKNASLGEMRRALTPHKQVRRTPGRRGVRTERGEPMLGFRGASRYYDERYREGFALECRAMRKVREEMGLENVTLMVPFCRTVEEGRRVIAEMALHGLVQGERGLDVYVMCEIPSNVTLAAEFAQVFDGFSIGSNDLTQLVLGVDRDSELVAHLFDERKEAVKQTIAQVIRASHAAGRKIGICGQAPSDYPEFAQFLVAQGIDSISLNPDSLLKTMVAIVEAERSLVEHGVESGHAPMTPPPANLSAEQPVVTGANQ